DNSLCDALAQVGFSIGLELLQDHGGDFRWAILPALDLHPRIAIACTHDLIWEQATVTFYFRIIVLAAHQTFDGEDSVFGIEDGLSLGHLAHQALPVLVDGDNRGCGTPSFRAENNDRYPAF